MDINYYKKYEPIDGKWYLKKELGSGAYGTVFEVERRDFGVQSSAMKIVSIPASQAELKSFRDEHYELDDKSITTYFYGFVEEFVKEFQLMAELKGHSNIVSYEDHDVRKKEGEFGWDIFIRMELLTPMTNHFKNTEPTEKDIIKIGIDICRALEVCNNHNIIHRDIKPSNIFISKDGNYKLGDFGVARTLEKTSSGLSKKGTYIYMAPEVYKGESYNATVDLYSLGILMYRMLNNNFEPFRQNLNYSDGERAMALRMSGQKFEAPANASEALAKVILKACEYNPRERFATAAEMRVALEDVYYGREVATVAVAEEAPEVDKPDPEATVSTAADRSQILHCTQCGTPYKKGERFCQNCRKQLISHVAPPAVETPVKNRSDADANATVGINSDIKRTPPPSVSVNNGAGYKPPIDNWRSGGYVPPANTPAHYKKADKSKNSANQNNAKNHPVIAWILIVIAAILIALTFKDIVPFILGGTIEAEVLRLNVNLLISGFALTLISVVLLKKRVKAPNIPLIAVIIVAALVAVFAANIFFESILQF